MKDITTIILAVAVLVLGSAFFLKDTTVVVNQDGEKVGAFPGPDVYQEVTFHEGIVSKKVSTTALAPTSQYSTSTLTLLNSGSTYFLSASGTLITLPAVQDGLNFKFVVGGALDTASTTIDSAEGDNIEGTLIVAGAVVDCAAEDQININPDLENIGDYIELYSDGTYWYIGDSGFLTAASVTCTDPS